MLFSSLGKHKHTAHIHTSTRYHNMGRDGGREGVTTLFLVSLESSFAIIFQHLLAIERREEASKKLKATYQMTDFGAC